MKIGISGDYLAECRAKISLSFDGAPLSVKLRVPARSKWAKFNTGSTEYGAAAGYFELTLDKPCDIDADFDGSVRVTRLEPHKTRGNLDWKKFRWVAATHNPAGAPDSATADPDTYLDGGACILHIGPTLLCRSKLIGSTEEEMFGDHSLPPDLKCISCERVHTTDAVNMEFILTFEDGRKYHVCDYASGTNVNFDDKHSFSIYF